MEITYTQVPLWLSALFTITFATVPTYLIANSAKNAFLEVDVSKANFLKKRILLFYTVFFSVISILSLSGFYIKNTLPPRILIAGAVPLFLFYQFYVQRTKWFQLLWKFITIEALIRIHVFRFVGVFFLLVYYYDAIPKQFAYAGAIGDILTAVLVFPVLKLIKNKSKYLKNSVLIWNVLGTLDILIVLYAALILTYKAVETGTEGVLQFAMFPFCWLPAFAPATIIFLHILIFKKIKTLPLN